MIVRVPYSVARERGQREGADRERRRIRRVLKRALSLAEFGRMRGLAPACCDEIVAGILDATRKGAGRKKASHG